MTLLIAFILIHYAELSAVWYFIAAVVWAVKQFVHYGVLAIIHDNVD